MAGQLTRNFSADGYATFSPGNAPERYSESVVYYVASEYYANALQVAESLGLPVASVQRLTAEIAESLGLDIPEAVLSQSPPPSDSELAAYSGAHVIVVIAIGQLSASLQAEIAAQQPADSSARSSASEGQSSAANTTTTTTTTTRPRRFPTATTMISTEVSEPTVSLAPSPGTNGGPPAVPQITFGVDEVSETPNIKVTVQDGPDEGGQLRYLVRRGSELKIEVLSRVGMGTVRVSGYNQTGSTSLFSGAWLSFTANISGVHNVTFIPDSTREAELIFQIDVS